MKRFLAVAVVIALVVPVVCSAEMGWGPGQMWKYKNPFWFDSTLTFWAPFNNPGVPLELYRGTGSFTFTRAHDATHTATYLHPGTDLLTVADNNAGRIEAKGILIEGARSNLALKSDDFGDGTVWLLQVTGTGVNPVITADNGVAPDGTLTADRVQFDAGASGSSGLVQYVNPLSNPHTGSISIYIKTTQGNTEELTLGDAQTAHHTITVTGAWQRFTKTTTVNTDTHGVHVRTITNGIPGTSSPLADVLIWRGQMEMADFVSSGVPTTISVVGRNADVLTVPTSGNIDNVAGTLALEWAPVYASTMTTGAAYYLFDAGDLEAYYNATDQKIYLTDGTNTISTAALTFSGNVAQKLAFRWGAGGLDIYREGAEAATGATFTEPALGADLYIGSDTAGANQAFSNIKPIRIWNLALSDAEMQAVTQ